MSPKAELSRGSGTGCCGASGESEFWEEHMPELDGAFSEALSLYRGKLLEEMSTTLMQVPGL